MTQIDKTWLKMAWSKSDWLNMLESATLYSTNLHSAKNMLRFLIFINFCEFLREKSILQFHEIHFCYLRHPSKTGKLAISCWNLYLTPRRMTYVWKKSSSNSHLIFDKKFLQALSPWHTMIACHDNTLEIVEFFQFIWLVHHERKHWRTTKGSPRVFYVTPWSWWRTQPDRITDRWLRLGKIYCQPTIRHCSLLESQNIIHYEKALHWK